MGNRIRYLRKEKGLTLKELGAVVGLAQNTISQYETGDRNPKLETWAKMSAFFEVSIDYLKGKSDFRNSKEIVELLNELGDVKEKTDEDVDDIHFLISQYGESKYGEAITQLIILNNHLLNFSPWLAEIFDKENGVELLESDEIEAKKEFANKLITGLNSKTGAYEIMRDIAFLYELYVSAGLGDKERQKQKEIISKHLIEWGFKAM